MTGTGAGLGEGLDKKYQNMHKACQATKKLVPKAMRLDSGPGMAEHNCRDSFEYRYSKRS